MLNMKERSNKSQIVDDKERNKRYRGQKSIAEQRKGRDEEGKRQKLEQNSNDVIGYNGLPDDISLCLLVVCVSAFCLGNASTERDTYQQKDLIQQLNI